MFEGAPIQECDIRSIRSVRRNPVIADLFHRMKYMERRGSGLRKIISESEKLPGYSNVYKPEFFSTATDFRVILKNVNYHHDPSIMVTTHDATHNVIAHKILAFCTEPHSKAEISEYCGYKNTKNFTQRYLRPLLNDGKLEMTLPDKPKSKNQKYITIHPY